MTLSFTVSLLAATAIAAPTGFSAAELVQASQVSLKLFSETTPDHVVHITGFKSWKSANDAKVKIYMTHDGMTMESNFHCTLNNGQVRCTAI
jgi:hypothetical protein